MTEIVSPPTPAIPPPNPEPAAKSNKLSTRLVVSLVVGGIALLVLLISLSTFTMAGTVRSSCYNSYTNVRVGAPVNIYNEDGKVVATSSIEHIGGFGSDCTYGFRAENVPAYYSRYGVQVGTYNTVYFDRAAANFPQLVTY